LSTRAPESAGKVETAGTHGSPAVRLSSLRKRYGQVDAVDGVDLAMADGEFFTLLGPSGSGKTSLLRLIAGFERPDSGRIELAGQDVTFRPPYARDVNTVFQDYALFPHMTVADNVEYGLRVKRVPKALRRERVEQVLSTVRLAGHGGRRPAQLSGGQRQRVALARAIVNQPKVLSFDEVIVTTFTAGAQNTLWIFGAIRLGQQLPEVNVVVLIIIGLTIVPVVIAQRLIRESGLIRRG
jgi:putative spermidine/putrescine transport system ATP-binding protein